MMRAKKITMCMGLVAVLAFGTAGCGIFDLANGALKLASGQLSQLTVPELIALNQVAIDVINSQGGGTNLQPLTGDQALAVINFFQANSVNTVEDAQALANGDPSLIQGLEGLAGAFSDIDPNNLDQTELEALLNSIFSGNTP